MVYQMAATAVTMNDLEGHSPVAGLFKCNPSNICAAFQRFQLTVCSHGSVPLHYQSFLFWYYLRSQTQYSSLVDKIKTNA